MTQPVAYNRSFSFTQYSTTSPTLQQPGISLDVEFDAIKLTTDQIRANMALLQRDDGKLQNASVAWEQLTASVRASLGTLTAQELLAGTGTTVQMVPVLSATGNGTQTAFTLPAPVATPAELLVSVSGALQPIGSYYISGTTLTLGSAPANAAPICVWLFMGGAPQVANFTGTGAQTTFTLPFNVASPGFVFATVSGVVQHATAYSATGNQISFSAAPPSGYAIEVRQFVLVTITETLATKLAGAGACCPKSC